MTVLPVVSLIDSLVDFLFQVDDVLLFRLALLEELRNPYFLYFAQVLPLDLDGGAVVIIAGLRHMLVGYKVIEKLGGAFVFHTIFTYSNVRERLVTMARPESLSLGLFGRQNLDRLGCNTALILITISFLSTAAAAR